MKKTIKFLASDIAPSVGLASSIIAQKNSMSILSCVHLETRLESDKAPMLVITASDSESWLQIKTTCIDAEEDKMTLCIDAKSLSQALRNLTSEEVTMEIDDEKRLVTCKYGKGKFTLPYEEAKDYPMPSSNYEGFTKKRIPCGKLGRCIESVSTAIGNDILRPILNSVHFDFFSDGLVTVATDMNRIIKYKDLTLTHNGQDETTYGFSFPKNPCLTLMKVLATCDVEDDAFMLFDDKTIVVMSKNFCLTSRLIEGRYAPYERAIPKDNYRKALVGKEDFINAIKRVMPFGNATNSFLLLSFYDNAIDVSAEDVDYSKRGLESVPCEYEDGEFQIGVNGDYLLQLVQDVESERILLSMKENQNAILINEETPNDVYEYVSCIMPLVI